MSSTKTRDASPVRKKRSFEQKYLRVGCLEHHQRLLLLFGTALVCDAPILEALFWSSALGFLTPAPNYNFIHLCEAVEDRVVALLPSWVSVTTFQWKSPLTKEQIRIRPLAISQQLSGLNITTTRGPGLGSNTATIHFTDNKRLVCCFGKSPNTCTVSFRPGQFELLVDNTINQFCDNMDDSWCSSCSE